MKPGRTALTAALREGRMREATPAWCYTHKDFAWRYDDGSVGCCGGGIVEVHDEKHNIVLFREGK